MHNNRLLNNYQQHQPHLKIQNNLLQNNQLFMNNINTPSQQNMYAQQMQQMHQVKYDQKQSVVDKDKLREIIARPIPNEKINKAIYEKTLKEKEEEYKPPKLEEYWKQKTNTPYKGILRNENYNVTIKTEKDLVVHRVTKEDKDLKIIENKIIEIEDKIKTHDGEMKILYAPSKLGEHKKKFDYEHKYKYHRKPTATSNNDSDEHNNELNHEKLKKDNMNYYKEQQKEREKNKTTFNTAIEQLMSDGVFDADELATLNTNTTSKKQKYLDRRNNK